MNAVTHGAVDGGRTQITAWLSPARLQMEVEDSGPGFRPAPVADTRDRGSGWGLEIVDGVADQWGVTVGPGTHVWCEFARSRAAGVGT